MPLDNAGPLLTPAEVATLFRVDPKTVTRWAKAGRLTSIRTLGGHRRYRENEIRALLGNVTEKTPDPLAAPLHMLWPSAPVPAGNRLRDHGVVTIGDLAALSASDLRDMGLRPQQVDEVRLGLYRKGLTLRGEILGSAA